MTIEKLIEHLLLEDKTHLIMKSNLNDEQKKEVINHFNKFPHKEKMIDWNKLKTLTYNDFKKIINSESKALLKNKVKNEGIKGLKEGRDYKTVYEEGSILAVVPKNYKASVLIASRDVGGVEGKWCTAYQKTDQYWISYNSKGNLIYVIDFENNNKMAMYKKLHETSYWDSSDTVVSKKDFLEFTFGSEDEDKFNKMVSKIPKVFNNYSKRLHPDVIKKIASQFRGKDSNKVNPKAIIVLNILTDILKNDDSNYLSVLSLFSRDSRPIDWNDKNMALLVKKINILVAMAKKIPYNLLSDVDNYKDLENTYKKFRESEENKEPKLKKKNFLDLVPGVNFRVMKDAVLYFPQTSTQLKEISDKTAENDTEGFKKNIWSSSFSTLTGYSNLESAKETLDASFVIIVLRDKQGQVDWNNRYIGISYLKKVKDGYYSKPEEKVPDLYIFNKNKINSDIKLETLNLSKETESFLLNLKIHTSPSKVKKTKENYGVTDYQLNKKKAKLASKNKEKDINEKV